MPRSKRDKKVSLTKTNKKGLDLKQRVVVEIRKCVEKYQNVFVFTVNNMRNAKLKDLRAEWRESRFFFGKNKVMGLALGKTKADEVEDQLNLVTKRLSGQCGLLFTDRSVKDVMQWFEEFGEDDYARSGFIATEDVTLPAGPLEDFSHAIEPHLRKLGLPTTLQKGVIHLLKDHQVCLKGSALTPEQASILKLIGRRMATFKLLIKCHWTKGEGYQTNKKAGSIDSEEEPDDNNTQGDEKKEENEEDDEMDEN